MIRTVVTFLKKENVSSLSLSLSLTLTVPLYFSLSLSLSLCLPLSHCTSYLYLIISPCVAEFIFKSRAVRGMDIFNQIMSKHLSALLAVRGVFREDLVHVNPPIGFSKRSKNRGKGGKSAQTKSKVRHVRHFWSAPPSNPALEYLKTPMLTGRNSIPLAEVLTARAHVASTQGCPRS